MNAYSEDLRKKIVEAKKPGMPTVEGMTLSGMGPALAVEGATTRTVFEAYSEKALGSSPRPGQVAVMENLSVHKGERVRELVESAGCELLYLPPYSPDFRPIEEVFCAKRRPGAGKR